MKRLWNRRCVGCGKRHPRASLVRFRNEPAALQLDDDRRTMGRGIYLCPNDACIRRAAKNRRRWRPQRSAEIELGQLRLAVSTALKSRIKRAILVAGRQGALCLGNRAIRLALEADCPLSAVVMAQDMGMMRRADLERLLATHRVEWRGFGCKSDPLGVLASGPVSAIGVLDEARGRSVVEDIDRLCQLPGVEPM